jgi:16S rRNA (cytosine967-C5)-methyltransferase
MHAERSTARATAFEILLRVERDDAWASVLLEQRETELADPRDAALTHEIVLGVLRRRSLLDHCIGRVATRPVGKMDREVRTALRIGVYSLLFLDRVPDHAAVSSAVDLVAGRERGGRAGFVNGVLRAVARGKAAALPSPPTPPDTAGLARYHAFPRWWVARLVRRLGWEAAAAVLAASNQPAATVLRVDTARTTIEKLGRDLAAQGVEVEPGRYAPFAIRVSSGNPRRTTVLDQGLAWVQDEAAQLVPMLLGPDPGPRVADLCAAPGGKTLQLAAGLRDGGLVVAVDRNPFRTALMKSNLERHAVGNALVVLGDATSGSSALRPGFDQVLVDAPCSGTGTLRRHPEIRWRLRQSDLKLLAARQLDLLEAAAELLRPGGVMAYAVCSMEPEEGEEVVSRFLASRPDFMLADPRPWLPDPARALVREPGYLETSPARGGLDGFFAARLERRRTEAS